MFFADLQTTGILLLLVLMTNMSTYTNCFRAKDRRVLERALISRIGNINILFGDTGKHIYNPPNNNSIEISIAHNVQLNNG